MRCKRMMSKSCTKHLFNKCQEAGINHDEMNEVFMIASLVSGSIMIRHHRRAVEYWNELNETNYFLSLPKSSEP